MGSHYSATGASLLVIISLLFFNGRIDAQNRIPDPCTFPFFLPGNHLVEVDSGTLPPAFTNFTAGSQFLFRCDSSNYTLYGNWLVYCVGPAWSANFPTCRLDACRQCPMPSNLSPALRLFGNVPLPIRNTQVLCGIQIPLQCDQGYQLIGSNIIKCVGPNWDKPWPSCSPACEQCVIPELSPALLLMRNGSELPPPGTLFNCGAQLDFSCASDYRVVGAKVATCKGPNWDVPLPACQCQPCPLPNNLTQHLYALDADGVTAPLVFTCGMDVRLICDSGWVIQGNSYVHCVGPNWDRAFGQCVNATTGKVAPVLSWTEMAYVPPGPLPCHIPLGVSEWLTQTNGMDLPSAGAVVQAGATIYVRCMRPDLQIIGNPAISCVGPEWASVFPTCA